MIITANQLKTNGVSLLDSMMETVSQIMISVRGKPRYVVLPIHKYEEMYESALDNALKESQDDITNKRFHTSKERFFDEVGL